jgi:hypothetical protein
LFVDTVKKDMAVAEELYFLSCEVHCTEDPGSMSHWDASVPVIFPHRKRTLEQCDLRPLRNLQQELQALATSAEQSGQANAEPMDEEDIISALEEILSETISQQIQNSTLEL